MDRPGTSDRPLRVAIVGSGPAAFYVLQHLSQASQLALAVDMFDALPTPFGLVRHGVAPDHAKIKSVAAVYHKLAERPGFRFFGNVSYGRDLERSDLERLYHQVVFCTGAQSDRRLGVPGEDLPGSHSATEFVAWYNGHPDFAHASFDLGCRSAVVIGVGNVAVDVARILSRTPAELRGTDIADAALEALAASQVREVHLVGRRGPLQAAFTCPEVKELGELEQATAETRADEVALDPLSQAALAQSDKSERRKVEILQGFVTQPARAAKPRRLELRFLLSPVEILPDERGRVGAVRFVRNVLVPDGAGGLRAQPTDRYETIVAGLVFRSVGYRGVALAGLPFDTSRGIVPNERGRVVEAPGGRPLTGLYVAGWIKRGPTGVIGTNKPDAAETVAAMLEDLQAGGWLEGVEESTAAVDARLRAGGVRWVSYPDWVRIDACELGRGRECGRPRRKFTGVDAMLAELDREAG